MTEQGQETDFYLHDPMPGLDALFGGCTQPLAVSSVMMVLDFLGGEIIFEGFNFYLEAPSHWKYLRS